jgi:hypothetical protein
VFVAQHLLKIDGLSGYRTGSLACAKTCAKKQLGGGEHAGEKGGEERRGVRKQFGTGNSKFRLHAIILALVSFRADLALAEAAAAFAKSPREGGVLFKNFLPRISRPSSALRHLFFPSL